MAANMNREQIILRSRQLNPCDQLFWKSRGYAERPWNWRDVLEQIGYYDENESAEDDDEYEEEEEEEEEDSYDEDEYDSEEDEFDSDEDERRLRSNQNNPNNDAFWKLRGYIYGRPDNWQEILYGR